MSSDLKKRAKELVDAAARQGIRVEDHGTHWRIFPADKTKPFVTIHKTPSDPRGFKNAVGQARRAGVRWPPKKG